VAFHRPQHILKPDAMLSGKEVSGEKYQQAESTGQEQMLVFHMDVMDSLGELVDQRSAFATIMSCHYSS
jgi:GTP cyclohydrolase III